MTMMANAVHKFTRFARLERILAAVCITAPLFMVIGDVEPVRNSISSYYNMTKSVLFYVPLTVAFMLFVVNGTIKHKKLYNIVLGAFLAGLVLFNHDDFQYIHYFFTGAFFLGNCVVIVKYTSVDELWFKSLLVVLIGIALSGWLLGYYTLFWAEWFSLLIIGLHYILESWGVID